MDPLNSTPCNFKSFLIWSIRANYVLHLLTEGQIIEPKPGNSPPSSIQKSRNS